jgi:hypothetical protein
MYNTRTERKEGERRSEDATSTIGSGSRVSAVDGSLARLRCKTFTSGASAKGAGDDALRWIRGASLLTYEPLITNGSFFLCFMRSGAIGVSTPS